MFAFKQLAVLGPALCVACTAPHSTTETHRPTKPSRARGAATEFVQPTFAHATSEDWDAPGEWMLDSLRTHALKRNGNLRAAFERWQAALAQVDGVSALSDPRLSWAEFVEDVQTRTGPQRRRISLVQPFTWPGESSARRAVVQARADVAWLGVEALRERTLESLAVAYFDYAFLGRELEITAASLELLRSLEPVVQARVRAGAGQADLLRLQVELGRLENDWERLRRRRPSVSAQLADVISAAATIESILPQPVLEEPQVATYASDAIYQLARESNPQLALMRQELGVEQAELDLERFRRKPTLSLGVDYIDTGSALVAATPGSGDDPWALSLGLSLPIWGAQYAARGRAERHDVRAAHERLGAFESELRAEIEDCVYRLDDAARRIALYRDALTPRAQESLELTLAAYRTGNASLLDLIDAERALLEFELSYWSACRDYHKSLAHMRMIVGGELS